MNQNVKWMAHALKLAEKAGKENEIPVGAVLVKNEQLLVSASNASIVQCDPTAHAEILVLQKAGQVMRNYQLRGTTLYVTLEPCLMCLGAIIQAKISRVIFGAYDPTMGAAGSVFNLLQNDISMWRPDIIGGLCAEQSGKLIQNFFKEKRK